MPDVPEAATVRSAVPPCGACDRAAVVQWSRRPTASQLDALRAGLPRSEADSLTAAMVVVAAHACPDHAIAPVLAARIHTAACAAPEAGQGCTCTPEPLPALDPFEPEAPAELPAGW